MVLSKNWKRLEENFRNKIISAISQNDENYKNIFSPAFFNILEKPLPVQKQTLHQHKALDLSYLDLEAQGRGSIIRVSRPFGAKSLFCWFFTGARRVFDSLPRPHDNAPPLSFRLHKLRSRPFSWFNVCFCNNNGSFRILKLVGFSKWLPHRGHKSMYVFIVFFDILYQRVWAS
jgi:hypothetical protein